MADLNTTAGAPGWENAPEHYQGSGGLQPFDVIDAYRFGYFDGNAVKYLLRWEKKGGVNDLRKALHYIDETMLRWSMRQAEFIPHSRLTASEVCSAFKLTGHTASAVSHLLMSRSGVAPRASIDLARRYVELAIRDAGHE